MFSSIKKLFFPNPTEQWIQLAQKQAHFLKNMGSKERGEIRGFCILALAFIVEHTKTKGIPSLEDIIRLLYEDEFNISTTDTEKILILLDDIESAEKQAKASLSKINKFISLGLTQPP